MKKETIQKKGYKNLIIYTLIVFLLISTIFLIVSTIIHINENEIYKEQITQNETKLVSIEKTVVKNKLSNVICDLIYISDSLSLTDNINDYTDTENLWLSFSKRKSNYDQIRYLDLEGNELIRVNYSEDSSYLTAKEDLQNKSDRYYFEKAMNLDRYQVYISKIDLNIENNIIEEPIKPMIRVSVQYYDDNDELQGIIVLNYFASNLFDQIEQNASTSFGNISIVNYDGYWIYNNDDNSKSWGFMYEDRLNETFANDFPKEWLQISQDTESTLITNNGVFNYSSILKTQDIILQNCEYTVIPENNELYIISHIDPSTSTLDQVFYEDISDIIWISLTEHFYIYFLLLLISLLFGILMTNNKLKQDKIKYFSEFDTMTNAYNRRAGFKILKDLANKVQRENSILSICFIDINSLKAVNDNLGHDKGDELILSVVAGIKTNIRESDYFIRLGGDEFLIIFDNLDEKAAELIWQRIINYYDEINKTKERKYLVSASHGIETYLAESNKTIDDIINSADEKMYNEKRIIKTRQKIIRN